ncbi:PIN domain-containing protein [Streptomyces alfalfae]|uniref:PIN domain-containing protein n=1 Tax=Streptomyces alfalfae TaxID=1642299 RepID=UPI002810DC59|nr:hypothetical protein [Streptomyces alfalfae]
MRRVVFDSNAIDPLAVTEGAFEALKEATTSGSLEVLYTHITIDELTAIPDQGRRSLLVLLMADLGRLVPTGTAAADFSRLNFCRVGSDADSDLLEALRSGNINHTRDALIAATARYERAALVTNERRLAARSREWGIEVLTTQELLAEFGALSA